MNIVRVLHIGMSHNPGGIESFIMNYYRNIDLNKVQFDFIDMYDGIAYNSEIRQLGGKIYSVPHFKKKPLSNYFSLLDLMKNENYQVIHLHMLSAAYILPLIAAKKSGVKIVIAHSHNSSTPPGVLRIILDKINKNRLIKNSTHFLACSIVAGKWMFGEKAYIKDIRVINNAINLSDFSYKPDVRNKVRINLNLKDKFVIGHVGRFDYQKNHEFLIDIFYQVYLKNPKAILLLVGKVV